MLVSLLWFDLLQVSHTSGRMVNFAVSHPTFVNFTIAFFIPDIVECQNIGGGGHLINCSKRGTVCEKNWIQLDLRFCEK